MGSSTARNFVLFYGRSSRGWTYDASIENVPHYISHYTDKNYYWLTFGGTNGKRMAPQPSLTMAPACTLRRSSRMRWRWNRNLKTWWNPGKDWYGQRIEPNSSFTLRNCAARPCSQRRHLLRYSLVAASSTTPTFTVKERESRPGFSASTRWARLPRTSQRRREPGGRPDHRNAEQQHQSAEYRISDLQTLGAKSWIDWVEINYPRMFWAVGNVLHFRAPDTNAVVEYRLQQFTETPWVFNVSSYRGCQADHRGDGFVYLPGV